MNGEGSTVRQRMTALFLAAVVGWLAMMAGFYAAVKSGTHRQMLLVYACIAGGLLLAAVLYRLLRRAVCALPLRPVPAALWWAAAAVSFLCVAALDVDRYLTEQQNIDAMYGKSDELLWQKLDIRWVAVAVLCAFLILLGAAGRETGKTHTDDWWDKTLWAGICLLCAGVYTAKMYAPDIVTDDFGHMSAVLQSVHNVYFNTPFTVTTSSIYGHYAIFLLPFLHRMGHASEAIARMMCGIAFLTELLVLYTIYHAVRSNALRAAAALGSIMYSLTKGFTTYWQGHPLRILPPALLLAYGTWCSSHGERLTLRRIVFGYVLCSLSIVFITDAGLVSTVAWSFWICRWYWEQEPLFSRRMCKVYAGVIAGCAGAVAGMVAIINFYNVVICHSVPVLRACFYPIIGGGSYISNLQIRLWWVNCSWLWIAALFFAAVVIGMAGTRFVGIETAGSCRMLLFCGVMGIGQSFYYYNRGAYGNVAIVLPEAVCCMAIMAEWGMHALRRQKTAPEGTLPSALQAGAAVAILAQLAALALATVCGASLVLQERYEKERYSMLKLWKLKEEVRQVVPPNTYAFGWLTQEVYADLGWDPQYHLKDPSDWFGDGREDVIAEINAQPRLLIHNGRMLTMALDPEIWEAEGVQKIPIPEEDPQFYYFIRENDNEQTE